MTIETLMLEVQTYGPKLNDGVFGEDRTEAVGNKLDERSRDPDDSSCLLDSGDTEGGRPARPSIEASGVGVESALEERGNPDAATKESEERDINVALEASPNVGEAPVPEGGIETGQKLHT